jgi:hypothetical protein
VQAKTTTVARLRALKLVSWENAIRCQRPILKKGCREASSPHRARQL